MLIAITGGIGAGKSTVARAFQDRGASVIDADAIARAVVDPGTTPGRTLIARIVDWFGPGATMPDGRLDRAAIGARVFSDADERRTYNAIIHPAIRSATSEAIAEARRRRPGQVLVHEIPLLTRETPPLPWAYDLVIAVEATPATQVSRLIEHRGHSDAEARARVGAQGAEAGRTAIADVVIRTDTGIDAVLEEVDRVWSEIRSGGPVSGP